MSRAITISEYLSDWLTHVQKSRRRKTYLLYEGLLRNHVVPHVGRVRLCDVRRVHIRKLLDALSGHIGSRTLQLVHRVLRQAFAEAIEDGLLRVNPCTRKDKPRHYTPDREPLTLEEVRRLLRAARQSGYYLLLYLALATGMRQGEIFGLRWQDIDFDTHSLYVRSSLGRDESGRPLLTPPKASRARRIDMGFELEKLLDAHRERKASETWIFTDTAGEPLDKDRFVRGVFLPLLKRAGVRRIRFHDLRHTSATLALSSGVNVKVVSERLGHSSAKMTLDVYTRAVPTLQRDAAALMEQLVSGTAPQGLRANRRHLSSRRRAGAVHRSSKCRSAAAS